MRRSEMRAVAAGTFALGGATWALWLSDPGELVLFGLVVVVTVAASGLVALAAPREHWLAAAIVIVIPVFGPIVALWMLSVRRNAGTGADLLWDPAAAPPPIDGAELAARLTRSLPTYEALVVGDGELRRATVRRLADRATADDLMLLRWARNHDPELAVDIALALEDVEARFATQLRDARAAVEAGPDAETHAALFATIARSVLARIVDASLVPKLVAEARLHHDALAALDPDRARELRAERARLDLAACRPELVLAQPRPDDPRSELGVLHATAAYARRAFEAVRP